MYCLKRNVTMFEYIWLCSKLCKELSKDLSKYELDVVRIQEVRDGNTEPACEYAQPLHAFQKKTSYDISCLI
jgi:hypothetical protein